MPASAESITPFRVEFEQVIADDDDPRETFWIGTMVFSAPPHRPPRGNGVDGGHPAADTPIDEKLPAFGQLQRQSVKADLLDTLIRCVRPSQTIANYHWSRFRPFNYVNIPKMRYATLYILVNTVDKL